MQYENTNNKLRTIFTNNKLHTDKLVNIEDNLKNIDTVSNNSIFKNYKLETGWIQLNSLNYDRGNYNTNQGWYFFNYEPDFSNIIINNTTEELLLSSDVNVILDNSIILEYCTQLSGFTGSYAYKVYLATFSLKYYWIKVSDYSYMLIPQVRSEIYKSAFGYSGSPDNSPDNIPFPTKFKFIITVFNKNKYNAIRKYK